MGEKSNKSLSGLLLNHNYLPELNRNFKEIDSFLILPHY